MTIRDILARHRKKLVVGGLTAIFSSFVYPLGKAIESKIYSPAKPETPRIVQLYQEAERAVDRQISVRDVANPEIRQGCLDSWDAYQVMSNDPILKETLKTYRGKMEGFNEERAQLVANVPLTFGLLFLGIGSVGAGCKGYNLRVDRKSEEERD